jgi:hypothetical protein
MSYLGVIQRVLIVLFCLSLLSSCQFTDNNNAVCKDSASDTPYCRYKGTIEKLYVNADGLVLIFINDDFSLEQAKKYGYEIKTGNVIAYPLRGENSISATMLDFFKIAFSEQLNVEIHSRNVVKGYLTVDRIWVLAE